MRGIPEEGLIIFMDSIDKACDSKNIPDSAREVTRVALKEVTKLILDKCHELNLWIPIDEFLKSGFEGKCWVFSENIVLETEYDTNGFWYVFKYIDQNTITHVMPKIGRAHV